MAKILGIDLGTTNSAMAVVEGGEPRSWKIVKRAHDAVGGGDCQKRRAVVGQLAKRQAVTNAQNTVYSVKRLIGRRFEDEAVQRDLNILPYKIVKAGEGVKVELNGKSTLHKKFPLWFWQIS